MVQLSDADSKAICKKFFKEHSWEQKTCVNHSRLGLNPIIIVRKDNDTAIIHLYDCYSDLIEDIKKEVENELNLQGGYAESFYLSLEDIDNLDLQKYVMTDDDPVKVLEDGINAINS